MCIRDRFNGGQRRNNDRRDSAPKEEFDFSAKPDSRRHDSRIDSKKNDRKRDNEAKENLKFANSRFDKKPMTKPEKKEKEEETIKQLVLPDTLTIKELADKMCIRDRYTTHIHASVESGNVFACQFHPEKSSDVGLKILKNFASL